MMPPTKKKKWADAPKEFPKEGEGYPFPQGGWAYGQSVGKPYDYQKEDCYQEKMTEAEKRTVLQLAWIHLLDMRPQVANYVEKLTGEEILIVTPDDDIDAADSILLRLFTSNNIKHIVEKVSQLKPEQLGPNERVIILCDTLHVESLEDSLIHAFSDYVSSGGLLLSYNNAISVISKVFPGKLIPRLGSTTLDKAIEIRATLDTKKDADFFAQYAQHASSHKQMVRLLGLQRFEVIDSKNQVHVLLTEAAPQSGQPLAVSFHGKQRRGSVYHSTTTHLVSKIGSQGGTSFQPLADMLPAASKVLAEKCISDLSKLPNPPQATITAWTAALRCGFASSINIALSYQPFLDSLLLLLIAHAKKG
jgi:hypothetical protein